jgi:hypothetical protein
MKRAAVYTTLLVAVSLLVGCDNVVVTEEDGEQLLDVHMITGTVYLGDTSSTIQGAQLTIGYRADESSKAYTDAWDYAADGWGWPRPYFTSGTGGSFAASYYQAACDKPGIVRATWYDGLYNEYYGETTFTWPWDWTSCTHDVRVYEVE